MPSEVKLTKYYNLVSLIWSARVQDLLLLCGVCFECVESLSWVWVRQENCIIMVQAALTAREKRKHATHARTRTDRGHGQRGCWLLHAVGRSTGFSHATLRKKTGWGTSEMLTHFALWCVSYRFPLPLPHICYLDDIPCSGPHLMPF